MKLLLKPILKLENLHALDFALFEQDIDVAVWSFLAPGKRTDERDLLRSILLG